MHHELGDLKPFAFFDVIAVVVIAVSGGSRGGAGGSRPTPLFLDQTKARRAEKIFLKNHPLPLPYLTVWIRLWPLRKLPFV